MEQYYGKKTYPNTVLKLFIKLYCKRRNRPKIKIMEAIKSWATLSQAEKQQFVKKYETCQANLKKKLANYLSKTQPYLRKKPEKSSFQVRETKKEDSETMDYCKEATDLEKGTENYEHLSLEESSHNLVEAEPSIINMNNLDVNRPTEFLDSPSNNHSCEEYTSGVLAEPAPPSVRTAREFYGMIHSNQKEASEAWPALSSTQKRCYQKAVALLKYNYIIKYKAYLESLPPKELFYHYNNYLN